MMQHVRSAVQRRLNRKLLIVGGLVVALMLLAAVRDVGAAPPPVPGDTQHCETMVPPPELQMIVDDPSPFWRALWLAWTVVMLV